MRIPAVVLLLALAGTATAQTKGTAKAKQTKSGATSGQPPATLAQLMKGILYPSSNIIFAAQGDNPADVRPAKDPATATDPLMSAYGKWEAVENAGLAIAEASRLLTVAGRKCSNGLPVPINNPDWAKLVQGVREAGLAAYRAAQAKDQDKILDAADVITTACANCHDKYREKPTPADRCK